METHFFTRLCVCEESVMEPEGGWALTDKGGGA